MATMGEKIEKEVQEIEKMAESFVEELCIWVQQLEPEKLELSYEEDENDDYRVSLVAETDRIDMTISELYLEKTIVLLDYQLEEIGFEKTDEGYFEKIVVNV